MTKEELRDRITSHIEETTKSMDLIQSQAKSCQYWLNEYSKLLRLIESNPDEALKGLNRIYNRHIIPRP